MKSCPLVYANYEINPSDVYIYRETSYEIKSSDVYRNTYRPNMTATLLTGT